MTPAMLKHNQSTIPAALVEQILGIKLIPRRLPQPFPRLPSFKPSLFIFNSIQSKRPQDFNPTDLEPPDLTPDLAYLEPLESKSQSPFPHPQRIQPSLFPSTSHPTSVRGCRSAVADAGPVRDDHESIGKGVCVGGGVYLGRASRENRGC
ncbi:hypothetical protein BDV97DRAFT_355122 [Delphinella strobiligena]|nr:hypothetical protein BDV97DRAFT_355122 [Delphinella strobiligena]